MTSVGGILGERKRSLGKSLWVQIRDKMQGLKTGSILGAEPCWHIKTHITALGR